VHVKVVIEYEQQRSFGWHVYRYILSIELEVEHRTFLSLTFERNGIHRVNEMSFD